MEFDVEGHLAATGRSVTPLEIDGQPARAVTLSRSYPAALAELWEACTDAIRIERWFAPVGGELRLGGSYQVEGNASGRITECERLSHFRLTWEFGGDVSWVEVRFAEDESSQTRVALTHTALLSEHWSTFGPGAVGVGWELGFLGLAFHIADPSAPKTDEMEFVASPDGSAFIAGSSSGWRDAAVAAGEDADAASAAERRTTAFYTGEPVEEG